MVKRILTLVSALAGFGLASAASAVPIVNLVCTNCVTLLGGANTVFPGYPVNLEVRVTVAPSDGTDTSLFGALVWTGAAAGIGSMDGLPSPAGQTALGPAWTPQGTLGNCNSLKCNIFSQSTLLNGPQSANATNFVIATAAFNILLSAPGGSVLTWTWNTAPTGMRLDFYGVTNAPGVTVTVVPEPATAAMLCVGLIGLALAARRGA